VGLAEQGEGVVRRGRFAVPMSGAAQKGSICCPMLPKTRFALDVSASAFQHSTRLLELTDLSRKYPNIIFELVGSGGLHPSSALSYLDLLQLASQPFKSIEVISYCNLVGAGDLALFLGLGLVRDIRPSACVFVPSEPVIRDLRAYHPLPLNWAVSMALLQRDHDACVERISEHAALDLILDQVLTRDDLIELLLVNSQDVDGLLGTHATPPEQPPIPLGMADDEELNVTFLTDDDASNEEAP
jgi:hypothetical protein